MKTRRDRSILLAVLTVIALGMPGLVSALQQENAPEAVLTTLEAGLLSQGSCTSPSATSVQESAGLLPFAIQPAAEFRCALCQPAACALKCCGTCSTVNPCLCICAC
jgi:hypothetical protein